MRFLLNLLWAIAGGGLVTALQYLLVGAVCCITIIGIPFGVQCFKIAGLALFPFGKDFTSEGKGVVSFGFNIVWLLFAGIWIFLTHLALGLTCAATLIGIPFAYQHLKLGMLALAPFGTRIWEGR
jgi:uncharacterized membrane protein YccF (DUF307 family)